jgi:Kef-type K+ transport system membrane component KefB
MVLQPTGRPTDAFTATTLVATSVGITARVMRDLGVLGTREAQIILGAAVVDDVLAMLLLAAVAALSGDEPGGEGAEPWHLLILLGQAVGFVLFVGLVGSRVVRRYSVHVERLRIENAPFAVPLRLTLGPAALSGIVGLAAIIGAFLAGMVLAAAREHYQFEQHAQPIYQLLVPFFFVITGAEVNLSVFGDLGVVALAAMLTALAIAGKLLGGPLAPGARRAIIRPCGVLPLLAWACFRAAKSASSSLESGARKWQSRTPSSRP